MSRRKFPAQPPPGVCWFCRQPLPLGTPAHVRIHETPCKERARAQLARRDRSAPRVVVLPARRWP